MLYSSCHVLHSFSDGKKLCSIPCKKPVPEKKTSTRLTGTRASFWYQMTSTIFWSVCRRHYTNLFFHSLITAGIPAIQHPDYSTTKTNQRALSSEHRPCCHLKTRQFLYTSAKQIQSRLVSALAG